MSAADKLRELLATRPGLPSLIETARWWVTGAQLVRELLEELDWLQRDRVQLRSDNEGYASALMQSEYERSLVEVSERQLRAELERMKAELKPGDNPMEVMW